MEQNESVSRIGKIIQTKVLKYELLIVLVIAGGTLLRIFNIPHTGMITTVVLMTASCIYFFSAFGIPDGSAVTAFDNFIIKLTGIASSVSIIGILYLIQKWPMANTMIIVGILALSIVLVYIVIKQVRTPESEIFNKMVIVRILVLVFISAGLLYFGIN
jgi:hypothetical protein